MPPAKSMNSRPSTSTTRLLLAWSAKIGWICPTPRGTAATRRCIRDSLVWLIGSSVATHHRLGRSEHEGRRIAPLPFVRNTLSRRSGYCTRVRKKKFATPAVSLAAAAPTGEIDVSPPPLEDLSLCPCDSEHRSRRERSGVRPRSSRGTRRAPRPAVSQRKHGSRACAPAAVDGSPQAAGFGRSLRGALAAGERRRTHWTGNSPARRRRERGSASRLRPPWLRLARLRMAYPERQPAGPAGIAPPGHTGARAGAARGGSRAIRDARR